MTKKTRFPAILLFIATVFAFAGIAQADTRGPVIRVGSSYTIDANTQHAGDVIVFGGSVTVDGSLDGRAIAVGGAVHVSGRVQGDVIALGGRAVLAEGASITGGVTAVGGGVQRADHVELRGEVNSISLAHGLSVPQFHLFPFNLRSFPVYSLYLIGLYLSSLLVAFVFRHQAVSVERTLVASPGKSCLIGLLVLTLIVPLTVAMAVTVIGLPFVLLAWLAFFTAKLLGYLAFATATGRILTGKIGKRAPLPIHLALGVAALGFLRAVPYAGYLFGLLVLIMGLGAAFISHFGVAVDWWPTLRRFRRKPPESEA